MPYYGRFAYIKMISFLMINMFPSTGYLPMYALASYVVYATTNGVSTAVQGGVYAVGAGGYRGFYPTWMAA